VVVSLQLGQGGSSVGCARRQWTCLRRNVRLWDAPGGGGRIE
jgi:hypothetical protein